MADKKTKDSVWTRLVESHLPDATKKINAIDFIEGPGGTGIILRPVQRVIVKSLFAVPFDYRPKWADAVEGWGMVPMWNPFRDELIRTVTEEEYIHIVHEEGRCNVGDWRDIPPLGFNEAVVFCGRRGGKLIDIEEVIPTPSGWVRNGDLKDGDEIFGEDGKVHKVVFAHPQVEEDAFKVSFDDGTSVLAHGGHLWHTYTRVERKSLNRRRPSRTLQKVPAGYCQCGCGNLAPIAKRSYGKIKNGQVLPCIRGHHNRLHLPQDYALPQGSVKTTKEILRTLRVVSNLNKPPQANHTIMLSNPVELLERALPLDPYCLGAWLGGGSKGSGGLTGIDKGIWEEIERAGYVVSHSPKSEKAHHIKGIVPVLRSLQVLHNKRIPDAYLWASREQRLSLLQGLMDTDGSCMMDGQCEFSNTNRNLSEGVYHLAASLGLKPYWSEKVPVCTNAKGGAKRCKLAYIVKWTGMVPVFRLPRKLTRLQAACKSTQRWRYIVSIEPVGKRWMRCITVDNPTGLYLFGKNFNVTHNSEVVAAIASYKLYLTLCINSPQKFFGLAEGSKIDFTFLAQDETGAGRLFQKLQAAVTRATWFHPYIKDNNTRNLTFTCEADLHHKIDAKPSIQVVSLPCVEEHELIWAENGLAEIGADVSVGDIVLDAYANKQTVTHKQYNEKEVWALETENFRRDPLLLTPNHTCIFVPAAKAKSTLPYLIDRKGRRGAIDSRAKYRFAKQGNFNFRWSEGPASIVASGDYLLFPRIPEDKRKTYMIDNAAAETQPCARACFGRPYVGHCGSTARAVPAFQISPLVCRLWGLYLAEGSIPKDDAGVNWDFHVDEKPTLVKFVQETLLSEFGLPSTIVDKEGNGCRVMCCSVQLARGFRRIFGKGCTEKSIPAEALYWTSECQQALIQGWLEGDGEGWFVETYGRRAGPTVSRKLAYSLFALGVQAGLLPSVKHKKSYTDKKGVFHRESWYVNFNKRERHYRFFQKIGDQEFYWSKVLRNAPTGKTVRVVDISVENTESFLTKLAAVHNCTTNAVRGPSSLFLALDEFAHFRSEVGSSSEDMYMAATPAAGDFHHEENVARNVPADEDFHKAGDFHHAEPVGTEGKNEIQDSLILSISSPLKKVGQMYELYAMAMIDGINEDNPTFALSCSSAEMNPKLKAGFLRDKARKNPLTFKAEYGGQFLESTESFVRAIDIMSCTDVSAWDNKNEPEAGATVRYNAVRFHPSQLGYQYFWGLDLGGVNITDPDNIHGDASALAIGHLEYRTDVNPTPGLTHGFHLVYDYIDRMMAGETFEGPGVTIHTPDGVKYKDFQLLPVKDILLWLKEMNKAMPCFKGSTDQHAGRQLITLLEQNEIMNVELVNLTPAINSEMAYALRGFINDQSANFPYVPKFIHEIKMVETDVISKYRIRVHAPVEKGAHDDMVDAAMLVAMLALKWLDDEGHLKLDPTGQSLMMARQQMLPKKPILNMDDISLTQLKMMERTYRMSGWGGGFPFGGGSHRTAKGGRRR